MIPRPPRSTRTDTLFPYTTLFRSLAVRGAEEEIGGAILRESEAADRGAVGRAQFDPDAIVERHRIGTGARAFLCVIEQAGLAEPGRDRRGRAFDRHRHRHDGHVAAGPGAAGARKERERETADAGGGPFVADGIGKAAGWGKG